jgi:hypothetical protein
VTPSLHVPDDGALFTVVDVAQAQGRVVAVVDALNEMIRRGTLRFPKDVVTAVVDKHDPETDTNLCVWIKTAARLFDCKIEYSFKREAQTWAQLNGYPDGLDLALGGRESCVVGIIAYILKLQAMGGTCCVVTDDAGPVPGRVALAEACRDLGVPTMAPTDFLTQQLEPVIGQLTRRAFSQPPLDLDTVIANIDSAQESASRPAEQLGELESHRTTAVHGPDH